MKKSRFSDHQIITILKFVEAGRIAKDICREHGISSAAFYAWECMFGRMEASGIKRMRDLEHENAHLKQMYAGNPFLFFEGEKFYCLHFRDAILIIREQHTQILVFIFQY